MRFSFGSGVGKVHVSSGRVISGYEKMADGTDVWKSNWWRRHFSIWVDGEEIDVPGVGLSRVELYSFGFRFFWPLRIKFH